MEREDFSKGADDDEERGVGFRGAVGRQKNGAHAPLAIAPVSAEATQPPSTV